MHKRFSRQLGALAADQSRCFGRGTARARNEPPRVPFACESDGYVLERSGELLRSDTDPHSLSDAEFFDVERGLGVDRR